MHEQSKAAKRRFNDGAFHTRYFVGKGLDVGAGPDGLSRYREFFPKLESVRDWDLADGDAQLLAGVADGAFDFVHSSHSLEHMVDVRVALSNWIRAVRPGGFLVLLVPDEDMYERGHWPSRSNADHKWTFTTWKRETWSPKSVNLVDLVREFGDEVELERLNVVRDFFRPEVVGDQTMTPVTECAIEIVLKKREAQPAAGIRHDARTRSLIPPTGRTRVKACRRGLMLYNMHDTNVGRILDTYGEYSESEIELFAQVLRPGDAALDVGANIGSLAVALGGIVGPKGVVHAFEPQEHVWRNLVANVTLNELDHVHCWNAAVGAEPGTIPVPRMNPEAAHSFGSVRLAPQGGKGTVPVPVVTIDGLKLERCRLIKADVEGWEASVVRGAAETIRRCKPLLYLEADQEDRVPELIDAVRETGYRMFWHVAPYCRRDNFFRRPLEFFKGIVAVNMLAVPPGFEVNGMPELKTADWRADTGIKVVEPA
jgi:FkbM family methyltransferase